MQCGQRRAALSGIGIAQAGHSRVVAGGGGPLQAVHLLDEQEDAKPTITKLMTLLMNMP